MHVAFVGLRAHKNCSWVTWQNYLWLLLWLLWKDWQNELNQNRNAYGKW